MNLREFTNVNGTQVFLKSDAKGLYHEPMLFLEVDGEPVLFTMNSNLYENDLGEFMLNEMVASEHEVIDEVVKELSEDVRKLENVTIFTLKEDYQSKLEEIC